jgi:hypothetical protein
MYAWSDVAERTEIVYSNAMASPRKDTYERLSRYVPSLIFVKVTDDVDYLRLELYLGRSCVSSWLSSITFSGSWNGMIQEKGLISWKTNGHQSSSSRLVYSPQTESS